MFLVSGGFTVLFRIPEKHAQFLRVNSPESGLQPSSKVLIYRLMEMFETGEGSVSREWELHRQNQGLAQLSLERKVVGKAKCVRVEGGVAGPGLCPGL